MDVLKANLCRKLKLYKYIDEEDVCSYKRRSNGSSDFCYCEDKEESLG